MIHMPYFCEIDGLDVEHHFQQSFVHPRDSEKEQRTCPQCGPHTASPQLFVP